MLTQNPSQVLILAFRIYFENYYITFGEIVVSSLLQVRDAYQITTELNRFKSPVNSFTCMPYEKYCFAGPQFYVLLFLTLTESQYYMKK